MDGQYEHTVICNDLHFKYSGSTDEVIKGVTMKLTPGSRCILAGDNGAGKTSLLKVLGGMHMVPEGSVVVLGRRADFDHTLNFKRTLVESHWASRAMAFTAYKVPLEADIAVNEMSIELHKEFNDRWDELVKVLDIDLKWRMHKVSDGQRRRVQLLLSLLRPFEIILLDEITTDLDLVTRSDFLQWLKKECDTRGVTIVYATHIFDGLEDWATDLVYMNQGVVRKYGKLSAIEELTQFRALNAPSPLMKTVEMYIRADRARIAAEKKFAISEGTYKEEVESTSLPDGWLGSAGGYASGRSGRGINQWG